jgi:hypothetical protein
MRDTTIPRTPSIPVPNPRRARTAALAALACTGVLATAGAAPAGAATVTSLDAASPVAVDVQGTRVAWLRPTSAPTRSGAVKTSQLVVVDKIGAPERVLPVTLPDYADDVSIGTDAQGRVVLLVGSRSGTSIVRADGTGGLKRLAGQTSRDSSYVMRTGAVAFVRSGKVATVRTATAAGRTSKVLYRVPKQYEAVQLAFGVKGAVALHAYRPVDVGIGDIVWLLRPGKDVKRLTSQSTGGASENGIGSLNSTANGQRFGVTRWNTGGGHPNDVQRFSSATGKRTSVRKTTIVPATEAVDELLFDDSRSVITTIEASDCTPAGQPAQADTPACLGLGLVD